MRIADVRFYSICSYLAGNEKQERTSGTNKKSRQKTKSEKKENGNPNVQETSILNIPTFEQEEKPKIYVKNRPDIHIDLQIHISPESTTEQIETIFACMAKHIYGVDC